jgi:hypothetical protein
MCCQASYTPAATTDLRAPSEAAWWMSVNLTSVQRSDRASDEGRFGFADAIVAIGSQRTTQVKQGLSTKVPHVVAQEPPPR